MPVFTPTSVEMMDYLDWLVFMMYGPLSVILN